MPRLLLYATILSLQVLSGFEAVQLDCSSNERGISRLNLIVSNKRNVSGEWVTWFSASQNGNGTTETLDVDLTRIVSGYQGNNMINIQGFIKGDGALYFNTSASGTSAVDRRLRFHNKCSKNAAITNGGRTLQRLKQDETASAMTNRPLVDNEVFNVRFDKRRNADAHCLGIGITTHPPDQIELPNHVNTMKSGTWMYYHSHIYHNSVPLITNILKISMNSVKIGQTVGIMRSDSDTLHFFIDGVDQGPTASNIPDTVYGVFELYSDALQGTIVDS